jgi:TetR/AcrR family transcriptional regulator, repressor for uid operon
VSRKACCDKSSAADRAEARRRQVLEAAGECFRHQGFHNASMAEIAKKAGMSPGHIYHYFANKEALIDCIVRSDLEDTLRNIDEIQGTEGDIVASIVRRVEQVVEEHLDIGHASLMLEVLAEAGRSPKVASMVQEADEQIRKKLGSLVLTRPHTQANLDDGALEGKVEVLIMLFRGLFTLAIANPGINKAAVAREIKRTIEHLFA